MPNSPCERAAAPLQGRSPQASRRSWRQPWPSDIARAHRLAIAASAAGFASKSGRLLPDHLASGALAPSSAPFESTPNSRTPGDHVTDSRSSIAALSDQLADAVATASASVVAVHARRRLPSTGVHWKDGVVVTTEGTVRQEEDITVTLPDGKRIPATFT